MMKSKNQINFLKNSNKSLIRKYTMQFLYNIEINKDKEVDIKKFDLFSSNFQLKENVKTQVYKNCVNVLKDINSINKSIELNMKNWKLYRLSYIDRAILRSAINEINLNNTPIKVVINEYINLAKEYGSDFSGSFVNGVLDGFIKNMD